MWLATGAAGLAAAIAAAATALGRAAPAYAVSLGASGTVQVSVSRLAGVAGANAALDRLHARVRGVPVRPGCPPVSSLPHPRMAQHPGDQRPGGPGPWRPPRDQRQARG